MKLSLGRIVIVRVAGANFNGTDVAPAIVNRVWSDRDTSEGPVAVNLIVLPDCAPPANYTSVHIYDDEESALALCAGTVGWIPARA
jgi:hypothetical protein